jgi:hypothetical protein
MTCLIGGFIVSEHNHNRSELIDMVDKLVKSEGSKGELDKMVDIVECELDDPEILDYIYWPPDGREMTPEEIVDKALAFKATYMQAIE